MHFCHAVGLGFLLFEARRRRRCPTPTPWEQLIARLVGRAGDPPTLDTTAIDRNPEEH